MRQWSLGPYSSSPFKARTRRRCLRETEAKTKSSCRDAVSLRAAAVRKVGTVVLPRGSSVGHGPAARRRNAESAPYLADKPVDVLTPL